DSYTPALSADGRFVAFSSYATNLIANDTNGLQDIFVFDRTTAQTVRASIGPNGEEGNGESITPSISQDGRFVAFATRSNNFDPAMGDGNLAFDVFVHDFQAGQTVRASVSVLGTEGNSDSLNPQITPDGAAVVFSSDSSNLTFDDANGVTDVFVRDLFAGQ